MKRLSTTLALTIGGVALIAPAVWAAYTYTGTYTISAKLGVGTDAPSSLAVAHVKQGTTNSTRFRLENLDGFSDFSTNNRAFSILQDNVERMTLWGVGLNGGKEVTFGQFAGAAGVNVEVYGDIYAKDMIRAQNTMSAAVVEIRGEGMDLVEGFTVHGENVQPGMVVSIDPAHLGEMSLCSEANDRKVVGIISGAGDLHAGIKMGDIKEGQHPVALTGRVWCLVDATFGAVTPGDSLTTSTTPGHAMKVSDPAAAQGATIGKAMSSLEAGQKGLVLVLVNLH